MRNTRRNWLSEAISNAIKNVRTMQFDLSTWGSCAATALYRATSGKRGRVDAPQGSYASLLHHVVAANGFLGAPGHDDFLGVQDPQSDLTALHEGISAYAREDACSDREATLRVLRIAQMSLTNSKNEHAAASMATVG